MPSQAAYAPHLRTSVYVGEFVLVRATWSKDTGELKLYRIRSIDKSAGTFAGEYWEQPRMKGSSLEEYAFDTDGYLGVKALREAVQTPEKWTLKISQIRPEIPYVFHWAVLKRREVFAADCAHSFVVGRKIKQSKKHGGEWRSIASCHSLASNFQPAATFSSSFLRVFG